MFPFDQLGQSAHAVVHGAEEAGSTLVRSARDAVGWAGDLFSGDVGVQALPVPVVVESVLAGDSSAWAGRGAAFEHAATAHHEIAADLTALLNRLEPAWTGQGAEGAKARTKAFGDLVERAAQTFGANGSNVTDAAYGFELAKRSMEPMGDPPDKSFFDVVTPWDTDTEEAISAYNAKAQKNLEIYRAYVEHLDGQRKSLSGDYGRLEPAAPADPVVPWPVEARRATVAPAERAVEPPRETPADPRQPADAAKTVERQGNDTRSPSALASNPDHTETAGFTPPPGMPDGPALGGLGSTLEQAARGAVAESGGPRLPGFSPVSSAPKPAPRNTVADEAGGAPRRATSARVAAGGRAAGRGGPGATGVTPAGKGRPEDEDHERKFVRDDDSVFGDVEDGLVDPRTGFAPAPPTIGT